MISRDQSGFTLIELLIVIALIGILAVIAIPQFNTYKTRAVDTEIKSNLHGIYLACKAFWHDMGPNTTCDVPTVSNTTYGFSQDIGVVLVGGGTEYGFAMTGTHLDTPNSFGINFAGNIS